MSTSKYPLWLRTLRQDTMTSAAASFAVAALTTFAILSFLPENVYNSLVNFIFQSPFVFACLLGAPFAILLWTGLRQLLHGKSASSHAEVLLQEYEARIKELEKQLKKSQVELMVERDAQARLREEHEENIRYLQAATAAEIKKQVAAALDSTEAEQTSLTFLSRELLRKSIMIVDRLIRIHQLAEHALLKIIYASQGDDRDVPVSEEEFRITLLSAKTIQDLMYVLSTFVPEDMHESLEDPEEFYSKLIRRIRYVEPNAVAAELYLKLSRSLEPVSMLETELELERCLEESRDLRHLFRTIRQSFLDSAELLQNEATYRYYRGDQLTEKLVPKENLNIPETLAEKPDEDDSGDLDEAIESVDIQGASSNTSLELTSESLSHDDPDVEESVISADALEDIIDEAEDATDEEDSAALSEAVFKSYEASQEAARQALAELCPDLEPGDSGLGFDADTPTKPKSLKSAKKAKRRRSRRSADD